MRGIRSCTPSEETTSASLTPPHVLSREGGGVACACASPEASEIAPTKAAAEIRRSDLVTIELGTRSAEASPESERAAKLCQRGGAACASASWVYALTNWAPKISSKASVSSSARSAWRSLKRD